MNLKEFKEMYPDEVDVFLIDCEGEINDADVEAFYYNEANWNNGDVSSGQYSLSEGEIEDFLDEAIEEASEDPERCTSCLKSLDGEDYITEGQNHPYGSGFATEYITVGYVCTRCGHREKF